MSEPRTDRKFVQLSLFQRVTKNASWVARHLNTSPQTVGRLLQEGKLEGYKIREPGQWHIFMDSVDKFAAEIIKKHGLDSPDETASAGQK